MLKLMKRQLFSENIQFCCILHKLTLSQTFWAISPFWKCLRFVIWKSFGSHISVVVCSFFGFGTVSKWCIREWVKLTVSVLVLVGLSHIQWQALVVFWKDAFYQLIAWNILFQRITATVNTLEQKRLLMDLDISMRSGSCPYTVTFYGALFREVMSVLYL